MPCILSLVSIAQMHIPLGRVGGIWDQYGRFNIMNEAPDSDSSHAAITTGQAKRLFSGGGGGGTPGGSGGDIQMNGSPGFAASKLNQASNVITYTGDVDFIYKSATDPNALHGLSFHNSSGTEVAFMKPNIATGEFKIGGNTSYTTSIYSGGSLVAVFNGSGLNLGGFINHGEQLAVQGQAYISSFVGLGAIPIITAGVALPASTTSSASFNITTGVQPTVGHTGDCYSDGTHGYIYMGGAWRQIDQQSAGGSPPFDAITAILMDHTDNTKTLKFALASITTGTARTLTVPNTSLTIAGIDISQTYTGTQTFNITNADIAKVGGLYPFVGNVVTSGAISLDWHTLTVDATSGNITLTLPSAASGSAFLSTGDPHGLDLVFIKTDAGANTVTITVNNTGTETINGATTFVLTTQWQACHIACVSTTKWIKY